MIFLSHNYKDKDVVGPVAVNLAQRYGKDKVFYDSWSIKPGDGIIDKMNKGLENCKYFFFFISQNSLNSGMVSLEWQSALHKSIKDNIEFNVTNSPTQTSFICTSISSSGTIANGNNTKGLKICSQDLTPSEPLYFKIKSKNKENIIDLQIWLTEGKTATLLNQNN